MARRRPLIGVVGLAVTVLALLMPLQASATPAPGAGLVAASGTHLTVDGHPWTFVGYNMPCAQPFLLDPSQLPYVLASAANNSKANALRMWFFQQNGGPTNWGPFDRVVAAAKADGLKIVPTLVNEWPTCEANPPITARKTLPWFQGGYRQTADGYRQSFHDFAVAVAAHYANDPTIAFWQLVNEAEAPSLQANGQYTCDEVSAAHAIRSFADDMTNAIHAVDPHHLVSLGTLGGGQCGTAGADYQYIHAGAVDLCEYHDYSDAFNPLDSDRPADGLGARLRQCQTLPGGGKPIFVGEAGIEPNVQPAPTPEPANCNPWPSCSPTPVSYDSLNLRAALFKAKISAGFTAGLAGYLIWFKGPKFSATNDSFAIGDGDPTEAMMASLSLGASVPATVPAVVGGSAPPSVVATSGHQVSSTMSPALFAIVAAVVLVAILFFRRARRRGPVLEGEDVPHS